MTYRVALRILNKLKLDKLKITKNHHINSAVSEQRTKPIDLLMQADSYCVVLARNGDKPEENVCEDTCVS